MPRKSPLFIIEEISGNQYNDLETAQQVAIKATAADLIINIRDLLAYGVLILQDDQIIPNPDRKKTHSLKKIENKNKQTGHLIRQ